MSSLHSVWRDQCLSLSTRIYKALALSVLLYAAETWTILAVDVKTQEAFHFRYQGKML